MSRGNARISIDLIPKELHGKEIIFVVTSDPAHRIMWLKPMLKSDLDGKYDGTGVILQGWYSTPRARSPIIWIRTLLLQMFGMPIPRRSMSYFASLNTDGLIEVRFDGKAEAA